jgi:tRNA modification GTPase
MPGDVIVAPATPRGISALAIVRLSGRGCSSLVEGILAMPAGRLRGMRRAIGSVGGSSAQGASVVAISWPEGRSFTGEEMVELICFGSSASVEAVLAAALSSGARPAGPGEFSRRALQNGRMNPLDLLSLASVWSAQSGAPERSAQSGAPERSERAGWLTKDVESLLGDLETLEEDLEGRIEFSEAYGGGLTEKGAFGILEKARSAAAGIRRTAEAVEGPVRVFIMGPVNSGKSSLFNLLAGRKRAVVSSEPGTTRDGAVETTAIDGMPAELHDSPGTGLRGGPDEEALEIAMREPGPGDCILWLSRGGLEPPPIEPGWKETEILKVSSCCDLGEGGGLNISSLTGEGIASLRAWIAGRRGISGLAAAAGRLETLLENSAAFMTAGEEGLSAAALTESIDLLRWFLDRSGRAGAALDRALARMCVGK